MTKKSNFADASLILALVTALLYISGAANYQGYLSAWGLESSLFSVSFHRTLIMGMMTLLSISLKTSFYLIFGLTGLVFFVQYIKNSWKFKRKLVHFKKNIKTPPNKPRAEKIVLNSILISGATFFSIIFVYLFISFVISDGVADAEKEQEQIAKGLIDKNAIMQITNKNKQTINVFIIDCSSSLCAGVNIDKKEILFFSPNKFEILNAKKSFPI